MSVSVRTMTGLWNISCNPTERDTSDGYTVVFCTAVCSMSIVQTWRPSAKIGKKFPICSKNLHIS